MKRKLVIYDNQGNVQQVHPIPKFIDESDENFWATRLFAKKRKSAEDKTKVDHWDIVEE